MNDPKQEFDYIVKIEEKGERVDHYLSSKKEIGLARSQIHRLIEDGYIEVNHGSPKPSYKIKADDRIKIEIPPPEKLAVEAENIPLDIVYEDADLIVVNKPRGMVVHPAAGNFSHTLVNALLHHCKDLSGIGGVMRPGIVHRLDKDTSGLMVIAKNDKAHASLSHQFKAHAIKKIYVALVKGKMKSDTGHINESIGRHPVDRKRMAVGGGKRRQAATGYKVLQRFKDATLVELTPSTGRTHQLRVHLHYIGHPILGDPLYGKGAGLGIGVGKGQLLHARILGFTHPSTGKYVEFKAEMPEDMKEMIAKLEDPRSEFHRL